MTEKYFYVVLSVVWMVGFIFGLFLVFWFVFETKHITFRHAVLI